MACYAFEAMKQIRAFVLAIVADGGSLATGVLSLPIDAYTIYVDDKAQKMLFSLLTLASFTFAVYRIWAKERTDVETLMGKLSSWPMLTIAPNGFYVDQRVRVQEVGAGHVEVPISSLLLRITNRPSHHTPDGIARNILATITFRNEAGNDLFTMDARWADTRIPRPGESIISLLSTEIPIGQTRELDIAFKLPEDAECYGINNDSFVGTADLKNPRWRLEGTSFSAIVKLWGPYVDQEWKLDFRNPGPGHQLQAVAQENLTDPREMFRLTQ